MVKIAKKPTGKYIIGQIFIIKIDKKDKYL